MCPCLCQTDPFWTASSLSPSDHREAQNQSICSLAELLELVKGNATLLLNLRDPPREHPYRGTFLNFTLEALLRSGIPQHQARPGVPAPPPHPPRSSALPSPLEEPHPLEETRTAPPSRRPGMAGVLLQRKLPMTLLQTSSSTFVKWG